MEAGERARLVLDRMVEWMGREDFWGLAEGAITEAITEAELDALLDRTERVEVQLDSSGTRKIVKFLLTLKVEKETGAYVKASG